MSKLEGQSVIVTAGGSGIGLACAGAFAADGANVLIMGRTEERLDQALESLSRHEAAGKLQKFVGDAADEAEVIKAVEQAAVDGRLDIAVCNAGTGWVGPMLDMPSEDWDRVMKLNFDGAFYLLKHAGNKMKDSGGGAYCYISSIAGVRTHRFFGPYGPAKAGADMLVRNAADELGAMNIRVNSVCPGLVETELASGLLSSDAIYQDYLDCMPIRRHGQPEDIAKAVRFLCGPESGWITGVNLSVDGGHHLRRGPNIDVMFTGQQ